MLVRGFHRPRQKWFIDVPDVVPGIFEFALVPEPFPRCAYGRSRGFPDRALLFSGSKAKEGTASTSLRAGRLVKVKIGLVGRLVCFT
jgi:hypothetical protein